MRASGRNFLPSLSRKPILAFPWPNGARGAISFSFDDGRTSAARAGAAILGEHGYRGTFFVLMEPVRADPHLWRTLAADGHEIGNHTVLHPCSGNFSWSRPQALEEYTLERMASELDAASAEIEGFFGARPTSFAYCCGQKFVGRGLETRSYVPLVAERFAVGRGYRDEFPNDPAFVDLAQVAGVGADDVESAWLIALAEREASRGHWLVLVGHEVGEVGPQTMGARDLEALCRWLRARDDLWVAPVGEVGAYIAESRLEATALPDGQK